MQFLRDAAVLSALACSLAACSSSKSDTNGKPALSTSDAGNKGTGGAGNEHAGADLPGALLDQATPPTPDTCITSVATGKQSLNCEGIAFDVNVPDVCTTKRCGFIMDVHGFGMNATIMETHTHMVELADPKGYIVLQPSAPGKFPAAWSSANDAAVFALMQHVIKVWHPDDKRIHFDGYSMGAWMTWRFVCNHSDILASAAPIAGGAQPNQESCAFTGSAVPARKIPVFYTHGRNDGFVPFSTAIQERDAVVAAWFPGASPTVVQQAGDYEWDRYTDSTGADFEFFQHDWVCGFKFLNTALKGHCFPGDGNSDQFLGCGRPTDAGVVFPFDWAPTIFQYFLDHPMK